MQSKESLTWTKGAKRKRVTAALSYGDMAGTDSMTCFDEITGMEKYIEEFYDGLDSMTPGQLDTRQEIRQQRENCLFDIDIFEKVQDGDLAAPAQLTLARKESRNFSIEEVMNT